MTLHTRLFCIAWRARLDFESGRTPPDLLKRLYGAYNPSVGKVHSFVACARKLFPHLNCGVASVYLQHVLGMGSVVTGAFAGQLHSFLLYHHNLVIDITADQFGGPRLLRWRAAVPVVLPVVTFATAAIARLHGFHLKPITAAHRWLAR
jgi:hypothetical protein